ncbi:MAG: HAD-IIIA family hydrolase [Bacteroidia bacterium]|jgi:3-deoxy-D-manno-octulosonate 8-phosphate phosphatase (KDO 8-P phosphatase)|nr:HAD-IIIA family hydrolase [Bacteroidia bacterium]
MGNYLSKLEHIRCFIFDVDGVLTDGKVLALASGEQARSFLVKDGYGIERALLAGYTVAIISGGHQEGVAKRLSFLHIKHIHLGVKNKVEVFTNLCTELNIAPHQVLYMGDDWPDAEVMQLAGLPCCPADATQEIKEIADYVSSYKGGEGCVRDVIEKVMKVQGTWRKMEGERINN